MKDIFPPVNVAVELQPEELSEHLLIYLNRRLKEEGNHRNKFHRYNETSSNNPTVKEYANEYTNKICELLSQAWVWLVVQGFLTPSIDDNNDEWVMITQRGQQVNSKDEFKQYSYIKLLPKELLDTKLTEKVWPIFIRGDFDTAVFAAFKEVEVRIRKVTKLDSAVYGLDLIKEAFNSEKGILTDYKNPNKSEKEADYFLFMGAIGAFKNPSSHRDINFEDPKIAISLILFANTLLQIVDKRGGSI